MELVLSKLEMPKSGVVVFLIDESLKLHGMLAKIDHNKCISNALAVTKDFKGKKGQVIRIATPIGTGLNAVLLLGLGKTDEITSNAAQSAGGKLSAFLNIVEEEEAHIIVEAPSTWKKPADELAISLAMGAKLRNYRFNKYFVNKKDEHTVYLKKLMLHAHPSDKLKIAFNDMEKIVDGIYFARDLVSMPPNHLYPATFAATCKSLSKLGVKVTIFKEKDLKKMGMNAILAVGQGSDKESHLVVMEWAGVTKDKKSQPVAFVGKGVTFDSGGISIKPSQGMPDMKYDMGGAAIVTGLMKVLASRKAKINAVGVVALVENMPSGSAQRPSDVITSYSGQTIDIDNTDAEGRVILADALWYTQAKYNPKIMVDLATLTGAVVVALGENYYAGLFSNDEGLASKLTKAGEKVGERVWRMPLNDFYDKQINSEIADVRNTGNGKGGGSITAAQFLKRFVNGCTWAHLDIAGMAWDKTGSDICPKGATGYGVRLLNQLVIDHYEQ